MWAISAQRAFQQIVNTCFGKHLPDVLHWSEYSVQTNLTAYGSVAGKGKDRCLQTILFLLQDVLQQLLMPSVESIKFSKADR